MKVVKGFELGKSVLSRRGTLAEGQEEQEAVVKNILNEIHHRGDTALYSFTEKFDGIKLNSLEVPKTAITAAYQQVDSEIVASLKTAAERIQAYHLNQRTSLVHESTRSGLGWIMRPLNRVGIHIPGFTAALPTSVLMTVIPAKVAGVSEIFVATPSRKEGGVSPLTLVACDIAGVNRIFSVGGAQAIAAMAFGTQTIPAVDKVCGPGNIYATLAKKQLFGVVGIDALQGPSEVLIIADSTVDPEYCAADFLAQAEHAAGYPVLVTTSMELADKLVQVIERQLKELPHPEIAAQSIEKNGIVAIVESVAEAVELANIYAPEHLLLLVDKADSYLDMIRNAGCVVLGKKGTVAVGDYAAGPSHVLPTGGTARFASPLNVLDFVKLTSIIRVDDNLLKKIGPVIKTLAKAEGLDAHAKAVDKRLS